MLKYLPRDPANVIKQTRAIIILAFCTIAVRNLIVNSEKIRKIVGFSSLYTMTLFGKKTT